MKFVSSLLLLVAAHHVQSVCAADEELGNTVDVNFSPKCAAALVSTAGAGIGAAYVLTPASLCLAGFCPAGVAGGSFASWWQSTMPLIAKGGIFSQLQSLAMAGNGLGTVTVAGGALGGAIGVALLRDICAFVDETDPDSAMGKSLDMNYRAIMAAIEGGQKLESECAASETCTAVREAAKEAGTAAVELAKKTGENLESQCAGSETCTAVKESISSGWNSFTTGVSNQATIIQLKWEKASYEYEKEKVVYNFGVQAYKLLKKQSWLEAKIELHILSLSRDCAKHLQSLGEEITAMMLSEESKGSSSRIRKLEKEIEKEKSRFGSCLLQEFHGIEMQGQSVDIAPLIRLYDDYLEQLNRIENLINKVEEKIKMIKQV